MKFFLNGLLGIVFPLSLIAHAPPMACSGKTSIEGEWIYFSPTSETSYYAVSTTTEGIDVSDEKVGAQLDDYHSGIRVSASHYFCNCSNFISATWAHLQAENESEVSGNISSLFFSPNQVLSGDYSNNGPFAKDHKKFNYSALEVIFGQSFLDNCRVRVTAFGGIHYTHLRSEDTFSIIVNPIGLPTNGIVNGKIQNNFWGIGPELGVTLAGNLGCRFSLKGTATGAFLIGKPQARFSANGHPEGGETLTNFTSNVQRDWRTVPYGNIRLGGSYEFRVYCFQGSIEVGYEALSYFAGLANAANDINFYSYRNVTMHGPYVDLAFTF